MTIRARTCNRRTCHSSRESHRSSRSTTRRCYAFCRTPTTSENPTVQRKWIQDRARVAVAPRISTPRAATFSCVDCTVTQTHRNKTRARALLQTALNQLPLKRPSALFFQVYYRTAYPLVCRTFVTLAWSAFFALQRLRWLPWADPASMSVFLTLIEDILITKGENKIKHKPKMETNENHKLQNKNNWRKTKHVERVIIN